MPNIVRGGSTDHNMNKKSITLVSGNAYFLRPVHLLIEDVQPDVHSWHLFQEILNVASVHGNASSCPSATNVPIQYLFLRCLPCLSRRRTHNQTSRRQLLWTRVQISESIHFRTHVYWTLFLVLVGSTTSQNIPHFLTPCIYIYGGRVIGIYRSVIWSKNLMELIFSPCGNFRWSPEGPVSKIHSPHLHVGAPGMFSDFLRFVEMLRREWGAESNGKLQHLFNP